MTRDAMKRPELLWLILLLHSAGVSTSPLWSQAAPPGAPLGTSAFFTTTDGVKLHYLQAGDGRPIVLVPGWTMPGEAWEPVIREFSRDYRTIALDPRAHGRSEVAVAGQGYEYPRLAADIRDLIEHLDLSDAVLMGWSMAGKAVLTYVDRFGTDRLSAVVLVDAWVWNEDGLQTCVRWINGIEAMASDRREFANKAVRGFFPQPQSEEYLKRLIEAHLRMPTDIAAWLGMVSFCSPDADKRAALSKVDRPLLFVSHRSPDLLSQADTVKGRVPNALVEIFPAGGHAPFVNFPERFNQVLRDFLSGS